ncbi:helix-turn-helix domain-containing protein [Roseococcus sp. SDR]|uniref:helix-turn-helix domain-containing protein n=1 Tax=Roseococcus sp. SDR TaxID=2835532 RepID=UPI001BD0F81E|nr:helix-turn-helix domain-containing protein [Roseococcus sp. SDR]MBS7789858.1 helix-turn-helix domain-containing protein [Roseococcus sp. SDR]MBV1845172.1 helix-turn-helix domain-containing protein [Roseococcus sp. SDR]
MSASGFQPVTLRTHGLPQQEQISAWRGWFDSVFDLEQPEAAPGQGFPAESLAWPLAGMGLSRVTAPRLRVLRTRQLVRRNPVDHWSLTMGGVETRLLTPRGPVRIPAGVPFIVSLGQELVSERDADQRLQLYLSRDRLEALAGPLDAACDMPLEGVMGQLLADYLRLLACRIPKLQPEEAARLPDAIAAMIGACVQPSADRLAQAESQMEATRLARVRRAIRANLGSARLSPALLCRLAGTSRSQLYRLLEGEGGVARYIQKLRLEASHAALGDARDGRSIAQVAEACGFHDPSAFSRAFRREFGATPSEVRAAALAGQALRPLSMRDAGLAAPALRDWLRAF